MSDSDSLLRAKRHPEKQKRPDVVTHRKPTWIRVKAPTSPEFFQTRNLIRSHHLHTVCEEAACPNIGECWSKGHATMMIMGDTCTRACTFCNVKTGLPKALNPMEPENVALAVKKLGLRHVVITSVDRDDLVDGGSNHFASVITNVRALSPNTTIEVLTPDFLGKDGALETLLSACPDVFNHNLETVPGLYPQVRPGARYFTSLQLLARAKEFNSDLFTKSGIMVGLGEDRQAVYQVMDDLRAADVDFLTIGQYLQPTPKHHPVSSFITPDQFSAYEKMARGKGFLYVASTPLTRSSYHADKDFAELRRRRRALS